MHNNRWKKGWVFIALPLLLSACFSDLVIDEVKLASWQTTVALPLLKSEITMADMIDRLDSNYINATEEGLIYFSYHDTLISYKIADVVTIPDISVSENFTLPMPILADFSIAQSVPVGDMAGSNFKNGFPLPAFSGGSHSFAMPSIEQFESATFESGNLVFNVQNGVGANFQFSLEVLNAANNQLIGTPLNFNVPANGSQNRSFSLTGVQFPKNISIRVRSISSNGSSGAAVRTADAVAFKCQFQNIALQEIRLKMTEGYEASDAFTLDFPMPYSIEAYQMAMKAGTAAFTFNSNLNATFSLALNMPTAKNSAGQVLGTTLNVTNGNGNASFNFTEATFDLATESKGFNQLPVSYRVQVPVSQNVVTFNKQSRITLTANLRDMDFERLTAYLGNETFALESDTLNLSIFQNTLSPQVADFTVSLVDPKLSFTVTNEYGVPFQFAFQNTQVGNKDDEKLPIKFSSNPLFIGSGSTNTPTVKTFGVTNLNELFSFKPRIIYYGAAIKLNPATKATNTINRDQRIIIEVDAEVPLHGRISNIYIDSDTFDIDFTAEGSLEAIQRADFKANFNNGLPLEFEPQFYMLDEQGNLLDSLFDGNHVFESASTDANGYVNAPVLSTVQVNANASQIANLLKTKQIVFTARLITAAEGSKDIRILDRYKIQASLGVTADILVKSK